MRQFDDGMQARFQDDGTLTEPFSVYNGFKQGCVLVPMLFSIVFSTLLTDAFGDGEVGININYRTDWRQLLNFSQSCYYWEYISVKGFPLQSY